MQPDEIIARYEQVKSQRASFELRWERIRQYQRPDAAPFFGRERRGGRESGLVYDTTAEDAADMCAAGIGGLLTGQSIDWHGWQWKDPALRGNFDAAAWLDAAARTQLATYRDPASRFGLAMDAVYLDLVDFSNACLFVRSRPGRVPLFMPRPIQNVFWLENEDAILDTFFYRFRYSARQAARQFGADALPPKIRANAENPREADNEHDFLHAVYPNDDPGQRSRSDRPFASVWLAVEEKHELRRHGYHTQPYIGFRWRVRAGERFGRGPSDKALSDVAVLQQLERLTLQALELSVRPSLMVPDDGVIGPVSLRSADITHVRPEYFFRGGDPIRPIQSGARPDIGEAAAEARRERIRRAFLKDMLQILRDPRATATQVLEVREEMFRHAAPVINSLEVGSLGPLADRTFDLLLRDGRFGPLPEGLEEQEVEPTFSSPVARAQRLTFVRGFAQLWDIATGIANAGSPEVLDVIDVEASLRASADALSVPHDQLRSPDAVEQLRAERRAQQQALAEQEAAKNQTTALKNMAPFIAAMSGARQAEAAQAPAPDPASLQPADLGG